MDHDDPFGPHRDAAASYQALGRRGPLRHAVEDALRELIIARDLAPGDHLVETELAERLQVSRGPVREALQVLHLDGWVELRPRRGAFVHRPSESEVHELFVVRRALESEACRLAAAQVDRAMADELRGICTAGRDAVATGDDAAVVSANSAFHLRIAEFSGVSLLQQQIHALHRRVRWVYKPLVRHRGLTSWIEHEAIVDALEAGEAELAAALMRSHTDRTAATFATHDDGSGGRGPDATAR